MTIQEVKEKYEREWMELPGVVSVGIGLDEHKEAVIKIGIIPQLCQKSKLPETVHEFRVVLVDTKGYRSLSKPDKLV